MLVKIQFLFSFLLCAALLGAAHAGTTDAVEAKRIEYLIQSVERLPNAKFIRNGSAYDAKEASEHLRMKLRKAGDRVKTADDFIQLCASKSYISGEPYQIRMADGTVINSETFLRQKLKELNKSGR